MPEVQLLGSVGRVRVQETREDQASLLERLYHTPYIVISVRIIVVIAICAEIRLLLARVAVEGLGPVLRTWTSQFRGVRPWAVGALPKVPFHLRREDWWYDTKTTMTYLDSET